MPKFPDRKLLGKKLRLYGVDVSDFLGRGAYSIVYRGYYKGQHVAVKVNSLVHGVDFTCVNEVETLTSLRNINSRYTTKYVNHIILRFGKLNVFVLLIELVIKDGASHTLRDYIASGEKDLEATLRYVCKICRGLIELETAGVIHGDMKPENIFLGMGGLLKVGDFGNSYKLGCRAYTPTQTQPYIPIEILLGLKSTKASDIWSLGVILYELIFEKTLFDVKDKNDRIDDAHHIALICAIVGEIPLHVRREAKNNKYLIHQRNTPNLILKQKYLTLAEHHMEKGIRFLLERMLEMDCSSRITASEILVYIKNNFNLV